MKFSTKKTTWGTLFLLFLLLTIRGASSQTDSCTSNIAVDGISFDTTSLTYITTCSSYDYILRYKQESMDLWSFVLSTPTASSYVAMGQLVMMKHYALDGTTPNQVKPDQGSLNILSSSSSIVLQSPRIYMAFQLNTSQPQSNIIYLIGPSGFTSGSSYQLVQHTDQVSTSVNYNSGQRFNPNSFVLMFYF